MLIYMRESRPILFALQNHLVVEDRDTLATLGLYHVTFMLVVWDNRGY